MTIDPASAHFHLELTTSGAEELLTAARLYRDALENGIVNDPETYRARSVSLDVACDELFTATLAGTDPVRITLGYEALAALRVSMQFQTAGQGVGAPVPSAPAAFADTLTRILEAPLCSADPSDGCTLTS